MRSCRTAFVVLVLTGAPLLAAPSASLAQSASDPGIGSPSAGGHGGRRGGSRQQRSGPTGASAQDAPQPKRDPAQRLDAGAVVCRTEADLRQHQAVILARLNGGNAEEAASCRLVHAMTAVAVVERHGSASTEIRLPGSPEQVGWTDAVVHDGPAGAR